MRRIHAVVQTCFIQLCLVLLCNLYADDHSFQLNSQKIQRTVHNPVQFEDTVILFKNETKLFREQLKTTNAKLAVEMQKSNPDSTTILQLSKDLVTLQDSIKKRALHHGIIHWPYFCINHKSCCNY